MEKPTLYRKVPLSDVRTRSTYELSSEESTSITTTVSKFFELFKEKHL